MGFTSPIRNALHRQVIPGYRYVAHETQCRRRKMPKLATERSLERSSFLLIADTCTQLDKVMLHISTAYVKTWTNLCRNWVVRYSASQSQHVLYNIMLLCRWEDSQHTGACIFQYYWTQIPMVLGEEPSYCSSGVGNNSNRHLWRDSLNLFLLVILSGCGYVTWRSRQTHLASATRQTTRLSIILVSTNR